ncbi:MAG: type III PLP-dependent enzyme [Cyanobacteriota bacterium]|nr:type III PLP-dependent enzyme [Cyanobacteriota bacterium]
MQNTFPHFQDVSSVVTQLKPDYPVYCFRKSILENTTQQFIKLFPGTVIYAVKCNPHPLVMDALFKSGITGFDVASEPEIAQVFNTYPDAKMYFMHPVKSRSAIKSAYNNYGIRHFTVDHRDELDKILQETGSNDLVIMVRVKTPSSEGSLYHLAKKFGADPSEAVDLMQQSAQYGCQTGINFHVGSQCIKPEAYRIALDIVHKVIEQSKVEPVAIDMGGGFPAAYPEQKIPPLEDYILEITKGLQKINPKPDVQILAEPGRALVASSCSLLVQVHLRKTDRLYINDGLSGGLSELIDSKYQLLAKVIRPTGTVSDKLQDFTICGVTCDSFDILPTALKLPVDIREGDWVEIEQVGAYSNAVSTRFNGFTSDTFVSVDH